MRSCGKFSKSTGLRPRNSLWRRIEDVRRYTSTLVHHVKRMLDFYKRCCDVSQKPEDSRRYRIIYSTYLAEPEDQKSFQDIAQEENVDISTIYKDHKLALRQLSALFFGYFE